MIHKFNKQVIAFLTVFSILLSSFSVLDIQKAYAFRVGINPYTYDSLPIGGGGYVTGIMFHPTEKDLLYIRTDVGGAYRWDPQNRCWIPVTDFIPRSESSLFGIDGMALDPNNPDVVYLTAGMYSWSSPADVLKSNDRGKTWIKTGLNKKFAGNEGTRDEGEPIAVDPNNSNIVFVMTHHEGLYKTTDAAKTWQKVESFPIIPKSVARNVVFDKSKVEGNATQTIYVGMNGQGVFKSIDGGTTWNLLEGSPKNPSRMEMSSDGKLYVVSSTGMFRFYNNTWEDVSPSKGTGLTALAVDPTDPNVITTIVSRGNGIFRTLDAGKTWTNVGATAAHKSDVSWWDNWMWINNACAMAVDPFDTRRIFYTDFEGIWMTEDITATPKQNWTSIQRGHEELCVFTLVSPTKGAPLLAGVADMDGFRMDDFTKFPEKRFGAKAAGEPTTIGSTTGIAVCEEDPNFVVRVGGTLWNNPPNGDGYYSTDNGVTWKGLKNFPTDSEDAKFMMGRVAVAAKKDPETKNPTIIILPVKQPPYVTKDNGETWTQAVGAPVNPQTQIWDHNKPLEADKVNPNKFYYFANGQMNITEDGGLTWTKGAWVPTSGQYVVKTMPKKEGEVWVASNKGGMFRSKDGGKTFKQIPNVAGAHLLDFGKNPPELIDPTIYMYGTIGGKEGIYRSLDMAASWELITDERNPIGADPQSFAADRQQFGVIYIGSFGRGAFRGVAPKYDVEGAANLPSQAVGVDIKLNGEPLLFDAPPMIADGRTLVPMRAIFEAFGAKVDWDAATNTVTGTKDDKKIILQINNNTAIVDNQKVTLDVPARLVSSRTMVPARFIAQTFGATVEWDAYNQTVLIQK